MKQNNRVRIFRWVQQNVSRNICLLTLKNIPITELLIYPYHKINPVKFYLISYSMYYCVSLINEIEINLWYIRLHSSDNDVRSDVTSVKMKTILHVPVMLSCFCFGFFFLSTVSSLNLFRSKITSITQSRRSENLHTSNAHTSEKSGRRYIQYSSSLVHQNYYYKTDIVTAIIYNLQSGNFST